jgi:hypothetical protein
VPAAYQNASSSNTDLPVEVIGSGRFLKVDQSANLRAMEKTLLGRIKETSGRATLKEITLLHVFNPIE